MSDVLPDGVMFNAYPDSCGGALSEIVALLGSEDLEDVFSLFYVLPSVFNSDLDRGFSIIDYGINPDLAGADDLRALRELGIELKLDFVLNHISVQSPQFRDILERGVESPYVEFFIDWNAFWEGYGSPSPEGYLIPDEQYLSRLFMRKPELPILKVPFPDRSSRYYWNTFYQAVSVTAPEAADLAEHVGLGRSEAETVASVMAAALAEGRSVDDVELGVGDAKRDSILSYVNRECTSYLGQMDLNAESEMVWEYYDQTLARLRSYGARIVRLDAFAYLHKEVGKRNFFNEPGTWDYIDRLRRIADRHGLVLLPEIHSSYSDGTHRKLADKGFAFYDFFFPGLVIDALESGSARHLARWIGEILDGEFVTINMLGCHDGIPVLDLKGLLDDESIDTMIATILDRGGMVKNLYGPDGTKISYYQVNATFFSVLGEDVGKLLLARALQIFMPGIPQVWYLDLFGGTNDHEAARLGGHKEINRTNLSMDQIVDRLNTPLVHDQLTLLRFRNRFPAFGRDAAVDVTDSGDGRLSISWENGGHRAVLEADLVGLEFTISSWSDGTETRVFSSNSR